MRGPPHQFRINLWHSCQILVFDTSIIMVSSSSTPESTPDACMSRIPNILKTVGIEKFNAYIEEVHILLHGAPYSSDLISLNGMRYRHSLQSFKHWIITLLRMPWTGLILTHSWTGWDSHSNLQDQKTQWLHFSANLLHHTLWYAQCHSPRQSIPVRLWLMVLHHLHAHHHSHLPMLINHCCALSHHCLQCQLSYQMIQMMQKLNHKKESTPRKLQSSNWNSRKTEIFLTLLGRATLLIWSQIQISCSPNHCTVLLESQRRSVQSSPRKAHQIWMQELG